MGTFRRRALAATNAAMRPLGIAITRPSTTFADYIDLDTTLAGAREAGLPVGEWIDRRFNVPGTTERTMAHLAELGVFDQPITTVCEIGPGSGRYLAKVFERSSPGRYDIYETAEPWRDWLAQTYQVTAQPTRGADLAATPDGSVDLVHTHKVLNGLKILDTCRYFLEMARVAGPSGWVVFDILTESCLDDETIAAWLSSGSEYITSMTSEQFAVDFFTGRGFTLRGSFAVDSVPGRTQYLVFRRA